MNISDKYELIKEERIEELKSDGFLLKHKKSGARIALLSNDDDNKVFCVGFRTPPPDSSGVPHILEHSVLCGSAKYPAKDPFVELVKGSLNTFLNAMTYPDKTVYPVASCNDVDFKNLTDVYMDAVLNPNIYTRSQIFRQEGWHYEMENIDSPLIYNGVVYNEMKGAYSNPDDVLSRYSLNSLYPDTAYGVESGGDPAFIPTLTYENFVGFHKKLYHPSNSYIYIYGNCDMEERLDYLDKEYLSKYDYLKVDSEIELQPAFSEMRREEAEYSVTEEEGTSGKTYFSYNFSLGNDLDTETYLALQLLDYALFSMPGAPVKQALIDAGIGDDIICSAESSLKQPMYSIVAKNTDPEREKEFLDIVRSTIEEQVSTGINKEALTAALNSNEFTYREADFGRFPKGLMYGLSMYDSWLYDENKPFEYLAQNAAFASLRKKVAMDYFEKLTRALFIDNKHTSFVVMKPVVNLTSMRDEKTAAKLEEYKATLSDAEKIRIVEDTAALKLYQSEPSTPEELATIPLLTREDISHEVKPISNIEDEVAGVKVLHHDFYTNGIGYLRLAFNYNAVADDDLSYLGLLSDVLAYIDTDKHSYAALTNAIDMDTGGIYFTPDCYVDHNDGNKYVGTFNVAAKAFVDKIPVALSLIKETVEGSRFTDYKRLREILLEIKSKYQSKILTAGHQVAASVCSSQMSAPGKIISMYSGVDYYDYISSVIDDYDNCKETVAAGLRRVSDKIFAKDKLIISFTSDNEAYESIKRPLEEFVNGLPEKGGDPVNRQLKLVKKRIGIKTSSQVNYVARCGNFAKAGFKYDGALKVLKVIMGYDYLWTNIRVKGGAYGCMNDYTSTGKGVYMSYRDPNLATTNEIFEKIPEYVRNFAADDREMTKYIIGTISDLDTPLNPSAMGGRSFTCYMTNTSLDQIKEIRERVLTTYVDDIKSLEGITRAILDDGYMCVVGNSDKIEKDKDLFDEIITLA